MDGYRRDAVVSASVFVATTIFVAVGTTTGLEIERTASEPLMFAEYIYAPVILCAVVAVAAVAVAVSTQFLKDEGATAFEISIPAKLHAVPVAVYGACTLVIAEGDAASLVYGITFAIGTTIHLSWLRHGLGNTRRRPAERRSAWRLVLGTGVMVATLVAVAVVWTALTEPEPVPTRPPTQMPVTE